MEISGRDILIIVVCILFVGAIYLSKSRKHADDHRINRRKRDKPPPE